MDEENRYVETGSYSIVVYAVDHTYTLATYTQTVISGDVYINNFKVHLLIWMKNHIMIKIFLQEKNSIS